MIAASDEAPMSGLTTMIGGGKGPATPASISNALDVADLYDIQVAIHADNLNETGRNR